MDENQEDDISMESSSCSSSDWVTDNQEDDLFMDSSSCSSSGWVTNYHQDYLSVESGSCSSSDWEEYEEYINQLPQIKAIYRNDLPYLKTLLESGISVNNMSQGMTPLHISITIDKKDIFDYLLTIEDVQIDAENILGMTPLVVSLMQKKEYYAKELLKKGADVNPARCRPLYNAVYTSVEIAQEIIEKGALINAVNIIGQTPLFIACKLGKSEHIYVLLTYGADATIPNRKNILSFTLAVTKCPLDVQQILFDCTFNSDFIEIALKNLTAIIVAHSPFFYEIMKKRVKVSYNRKDLRSLYYSLSSVNITMFVEFMKKYPLIASDFFSLYNPIKLYKCHLFDDKNSDVDFVTLLCELSDTSFFTDIIEKFRSDTCCYLLHSLVDHRLSEDALTRLLFCLLSRGVPITFHDLSRVFQHYKYGSLFKLLLHQEIKEIGGPAIRYVLNEYAVPTLIYKPRNAISVSMLRPSAKLIVKKFFICGNDVPSLKELARTAARTYVIEKYGIQNNVHFFTVLKWLPICQTIKEILSFERPLY